MDTKICKACNIEKEIEEFHKYYKNKENRRSKCRTCLGFKELKRYTKDEVHIQRKEYKLKNRDKILQEKKEYYQRKMKDPIFVLIKRLRGAIWRSLRTNKSKSSLDVLGCTQEEFKIHIENQFSEDMNWDRLNEIHIDHIIPISSAKSIEEVYLLNHYTNLQPLWAKDNLSKYNKLM